MLVVPPYFDCSSVNSLKPAVLVLSGNGDFRYSILPQPHSKLSMLQVGPYSFKGVHLRILRKEITAGFPLSGPNIVSRHMSLSLLIRSYMCVIIARLARLVKTIGSDAYGCMSSSRLLLHDAHCTQTVTRCSKIVSIVRITCISGCLV